MRRRIVIAGLLVFAAFGCGGSHTSRPGPEPDLTGTARPQAEEETPSPGTVWARVAVETCSPEPPPPRCTMTVQKVLAYGMSTSPLAAGQSLTATVPASGREDGDPAFTPGRSPIVVLREQGPSPTSPTGPHWRVVNIRP
jgi:hypothetical protein